MILTHRFCLNIFSKEWICFSLENTNSLFLILASRLIPIDVDLHTKKNAEEHFTKHYDIPGLVLRRGKPFSFTVTFNRDFDPEEYQLYVRLASGKNHEENIRLRLFVVFD